MSHPQTSLLHLLQLVSPALPVGAYSYSEGLETLVQTDRVIDLSTLKAWLTQELRYGAIRLEAAVLLRIYDAAQANQLDRLAVWNQWLSAFRETEEMREQSWQMGRSLGRLLQELEPRESVKQGLMACGEPCNFAAAFALAAVDGKIDREIAVLGYLYSWVANLINAGVRLIPLGQTQGQQGLLHLYPQLEQTTQAVLSLTDDRLWSCGWGMSIASMNHETLYSRLFRS
ncbi:urease accessory protein UreF [Egbenema bharatensis]|uniref:urease accessory protein UreF n=1 Tax=Egbenema bharatensis TaxID=3463334 RepID=UPI003A8B9DC5